MNQDTGAKGIGESRAGGQGGVRGTTRRLAGGRAGGRPQSQRRREEWGEGEMTLTSTSLVCK